MFSTLFDLPTSKQFTGNTDMKNHYFVAFEISRAFIELCQKRMCKLRYITVNDSVTTVALNVRS